MTHVMVPVPEEHLHEVREYLRWQAGPRPIPVPHAEALARACADLDATSRNLLDAVREALAEQRSLTTGELAAMFDQTHREVMGTIIEINERSRLAGGPPVMLLRDAPDADTHLGERIVNMTRETADVIAAAT